MSSGFPKQTLPSPGQKQVERDSTSTSCHFSTDVERSELHFKGTMKYHFPARNFFLALLLLETISVGLSNRLPYFINYFFDTYLLINEDTPV
ncbi:hypothetical protein JRQ81_017256, partial [Phrynocephalus forsythii]